jgi:8-oxo-dGTP pyrophosphatase MutT (NUDIX family)
MDLSTLEALLCQRQPGMMDGVGEYAVLVPLVEGEDGLSLLYEVRASTMRRQPGEVCFPGGRMEPGESPEDCALRETWEELSIPHDAVRVLGRLDFVPHRTRVILYPVLALVEGEAVARMCPNPDEVDETFQIPLSHLIGKEPMECGFALVPQPGADFPYETVGIPKDYHWQSGWETCPVYRWQGRAVWGLTGRITRHLVGLMRQLVTQSTRDGENFDIPKEMLVKKWRK